MPCLASAQPPPAPLQLAQLEPNRLLRVLYAAGGGRRAIVRVGAPVRIQFEGWPVIQVSGWPSKAVGTFAGRVVAIDASAQANGRFRILVEEDKDWQSPWPDQRFVRFGSKARGWVLLDTVSVGYEIWRQLNNFPPNFPVDGQSPGQAQASGGN